MKPMLLLLLCVPVAVLLWRVVVSKRSWPIRIGAAVAAAASLTGAFVLYDEYQAFDAGDWRELAALGAAMSGSVYLLGWAALHRGNRSHRTFSIVAAILGLVPFAAVGASAALYKG
jgi:hypothetical protein